MEVRENQMKEQEERKKLLFFPCFPRVAGNYDRVPFLPAWKGNPVTLRFWGCLCKVGFLLQCIQSEVLHIWTGTVNTDANTVWGARKCLLIICGGKKIYFVYLLYQRGVWGRTVVFFFISCEKKMLQICTFLCVLLCVCFFKLIFLFLLVGSNRFWWLAL